MQEAYVALDILTGRVDLFFDSAPAALNYIKPVQRLLPLKKLPSTSGVTPVASENSIHLTRSHRRIRT